MNMRLMVMVGVGLVATLASFTLTDAATYAVGKDGIWNFQASRDEYNNWASTINFTIGDVLVFNFVTRTHDVATVIQAKYEKCNGESPLALATEGPARITLTKSGFNYFICTLQEGAHCNNGLRLAINVHAATAPPPPTTLTPSPPPPRPTPSPPPPPRPTPSPPPTTPPPTKSTPSPSPTTSTPSPAPSASTPSPAPTKSTPSLSPSPTPSPSPTRKWTSSPSPSPAFVSSARMVACASSFVVGMIGIVVVMVMVMF